MLILLLKDGKIHKIGDISEEAKEVINAEGQTVLPGCIDTQTHFREPGSTDTEDLHSGSRAAIAGGITSVFEMPNTNPPTSNMKEFQRKLDLAKNRMYCNYAFYFGATADNANDLASLKDLEGCCGIKTFCWIIDWKFISCRRRRHRQSISKCIKSRRCSL
jgi:dihydroorotase